MTTISSICCLIMRASDRLMMGDTTTTAWRPSADNCSLTRVRFSKSRCASSVSRINSPSGDWRCMLMSMCSNSPSKVITGSGVLSGATCWISRLASSGRNASAVSSIDRLRALKGGRTSRMRRRSLTGTRSLSSKRKMPVRSCSGTILGTTDSTKLGLVCDRLSSSD